MIRLLALACVLAVWAPEVRGQGALFDYFTQLTKENLALCPENGGKGPLYCTCDNDPKQDRSIDYPFSQVFKPGTDELQLVQGLGLLSCSPGLCYCSPGVPTEAPTRPPEMQALLDTCPGDQIVGCDCALDDKQKRAQAKGEAVEPKFLERPWDLTTFLLECRPVTCKCSKTPNVKTPVKGFGCRQGGAMYCANKNDFGCPKIPAGKKRQPTLKQRHFLRAKIDGKCICDQNDFPICKSKFKAAKEDPSVDIFPRCPNGEVPDFSIGSPGSGLTECNVPEIYRQESISSQPSKRAQFESAVDIGGLYSPEG